MFQFGNISCTVEKEEICLQRYLLFLTGSTNAIPSPTSSKDIYFNSLHLLLFEVCITTTTTYMYFKFCDMYNVKDGNHITNSHDLYVIGRNYLLITRRPLTSANPQCYPRNL